MRNNISSNKKQFKTIWNRLLSFILTLSVFGLSMGFINAQDFCYTAETWSPNYNVNLQNTENDEPVYLKIYIHVIRDANGNGGQAIPNIKDAISILQQDFNPHNIYFAWDCNIDYIDSNAWFQGPDFNGNDRKIYDINNHYDGIDIYLFPDVANLNGGRSNGVGTSSELWVAGTLSGIPVATSHIISHQMGHCINLWHTHHGCETGNWEVTNGFNCEIAGDYVCDTPADPNLEFNVNTTTCEWTYKTSCPIIEPIYEYSPDARIIMAYTKPSCMAYFTNGQGQRMRNSIATLPYLQATQTEQTANICFCPNNATFTAPLNGYVDQEVKYRIEGKTNNIIQVGANVTYDAGNQVRLKPGFKALEGSHFHAFIDGCGTNLKINGYSNGMDEIQKSIALKIYPNPLSETANISYNLSKEGKVSIYLLDTTGKHLTTLAKNKPQTTGQHKIKFIAQNLSTGVYYIKLQSNENNSIKKLMIAK